MRYITPLRVCALYNGFWKVLADFQLEDTAGNRYTIPGGFVSDGPSVPPRLPRCRRRLTDAYLAAAIFHDLLYRWQLLTRKQADQLFLEAMTHEDTRVKTQRVFHRVLRWVRRHIIYGCVRVFGARYYGQRLAGCLDSRRPCLTPCQVCARFFPEWGKLND